MRPPRYCCFYLHQRLRLGWAREESGPYLRLVLPDASVARQRSANMLYCWQGEPAADEAAALEQLQAGTRALEEQAPCVEALYAGMTSGVPESFDALAERALGAAAGGWARGLLFAALLRDTQRFRFSKGEFTARSTEEVAERERRTKRRRAEQGWVRRAQAWCERLQAGDWDDDSAEAGEFLAQLQSMLALERRSPHWNLLARPLGLHNLHVLDVSTRLKSWLEIARAWPDWPTIWLQGAEVERTFAAEFHEAAQPLAEAPPQREGRRDRTRDEVYTIDSAGTRDYDDALSVLETDDRGVTLAIHIAELPPELEPGTPLFDEAARRMASVYSLEGVFPMFPECLSTGRFSLVAGAERETVAFIVRIEEGCARLREVQRAHVRVRRNLDHAAAQALLEDQPETWGRLGTLCGTLTDARAQAGAVIMERREALLDISDPRHIRVSEVVRSGPAHRLVEEVAILYNREAGRYCRDHHLPGIYRIQPSSRSSVADPGEGEQHMAARFSTHGAGHAGLACDRYIQTTSPIRRFPDLVMQRQIAEHAAHGRVTFADRAVLEAWAERADARLGTYDDVSRRIAADWKRRYLLQNPRQLFEGTAQRRWDSPNGRVWLEPLHLQAQCVLPGGVKDGDTVRVRVESVDRDHQTVWVACVE